MAECRTSAHAKYDIKYHLVWISKYRYKVLRGAVVADLVDMLVSAPLHLAPSKLVQ